MKNKSIWEDSISIDNKQENFKKINTDILIIGGGITGLTTAYFLKDTNKKITIIDKSNVGMGVTCKTTAKITYLQKDIYSKLKNFHGEYISKKYLESQKEAIRLLTKIIKDNNISCDFEKVKSVIFTMKRSGVNKIKKEKNLLSSWNIKVKEYKNKNILSAISVDDTYIFHPLKYLNAIKNIIKDKVSIYENTIAKSIIKKDNQYIIETNQGKIYTTTVVIACHYPFFIFPNLFPLKTYIEREYINSSKIKEPKKFTAINIDKQVHSIRYYQDYIIYVSNNHRLTSKINYKKNYDQSRKNFNKYFQLKPKYTWMNQDIISNDKLPIIGRLKENLYISTAYNAWGMTNGTIGAKVIADLIKNKENKYQNIFNPSRINIPLIFHSIIGSFHYLKAYIESVFHKSNPYYIKIKGMLYGIYIDKFGIKHQVKLICPHMKCPLVFNQEEKTWDCPCHGSRYDIDGNILSEPTTKNIKKDFN